MDNWAIHRYLAGADSVGVGGESLLLHDDCGG
jgi:hypothetical protein